MKEPTERARHAIGVVRAVALLSALALAVSACTQTGTPTGQASASSGTPRRGGTLIVGLPSETPHLDFQVTAGGATTAITTKIYEHLVELDLSKADVAPAVVPGLATSWEVSSDALTWTFHLRQGVKFHNGEAFTSRDVVATFRRSWDKNSPYYLPEAAGTPSVFTNFLAAIEAPDDATVVMKMNQPFGDAIDVMAVAPGLAIYSESILKQYPPKEISTTVPTTVGTGPFKLLDWQRGVQIVLARNDAYWGQKPYIDQLVYRPIADPAARAAAIQHGEIDIDRSPVVDLIEVLRKDSNLQVLFTDAPNIYFFLMDFQAPPTKELKFRQAINYAIDRGAFANGLLKGMTLPATQFYPPANPAYDPTRNDVVYDPAKARQLLAETSYKGETLKITCPSSAPGFLAPVEVSQLLQSQLGAVGVKLQLDCIEQTTYEATAQRVGIPPGYNFTVRSWNSTAGLPFVTNQHFNSAFIAPKGTNWSHYSNPAFDAKINEALAATNPARRIELYRQAQDILAKDSAFIPLMNSRSPVVIRKEVRGYVPARSFFDQFFTVWLDR